MALSEWDVLSLDERGRPSNGTSETSPAGLTINPYEGLLQVAGADCWHPQCSFAPPQCAVVRAGDFTLLDVSVVARPVMHEPSGSIRGLVWVTWFDRGGEVAATAGITVRGFDAAGKYSGVTAADVRLFAQTLAGWVKDGRVPRELADLNTGNALRFNQGDHFFAKQMGHACSATAPGTAELPMLYHTQRREAIAPYIVRRDAEAGTAPARRPRKAAKKTKPGGATAKTAKKKAPPRRAA